MADASSNARAVPPHHAASSSATSAAESHSPLTVATDSDSTTPRMHAAYDAQEMHTAAAASSAHSITRAVVTSSALPVNGTAASSTVVENGASPSAGPSAAAANSPKVRALLAINGGAGLLHPLSSHSTASTSSTVGATSSSQLMKSLPGSAYAGPAHPIRLQSNSPPLDSVTSGHLTNSAPVAVAPIAAAAAASSSHPISIDPHPIRTAGPSAASTHPPLPRRLLRASDVQQEEKVSALDASLAECWSRPKTAAAAAAAAVIPSLDAPSPRPHRDCDFLDDTVCHCLTVNESPSSVGRHGISPDDGEDRNLTAG